MANLKLIEFAKESYSFKESAEKIELSASAKEILANDNSKTVAYAIDWQLDAKRQNSANTKEMSEISGTTAKPYKQKGTGHARQGSKRSVQFRGGRTCFGPSPRITAYSLPKKIAKLALKAVLLEKIANNQVVLFQTADAIKTAVVNKALNEGKINKALFVYSSENREFPKSVRNLRNAKALAGDALNVYDIIKHDFVVLDQNLLTKIKEVIL